MQYNLFRCTPAVQELDVYFGASFELLGRFLTVLNVTSNGQGKLLPRPVFYKMQLLLTQMRFHLHLGRVDPRPVSPVLPNARERSKDGSAAEQKIKIKMRPGACFYTDVIPSRTSDMYGNSSAAC